MAGEKGGERKRRRRVPPAITGAASRPRFSRPEFSVADYIFVATDEPLRPGAMAMRGTRVVPGAPWDPLLLLASPLLPSPVRSLSLTGGVGRPCLSAALAYATVRGPCPLPRIRAWVSAAPAVASLDVGVRGRPAEGC